MDAQSYWFSSGAAGGGGGDEGFPIGNSLRFRGTGAQQLIAPVRSTGAIDWTWSAWVKRARDNQGTNLWSPVVGNNSTTPSIISSYGLRFQLNNTQNFGYQTGEFSVTGPNSGDALFRDTAAWYNVVCQCRTSNNSMTLWVNGEQVARDAIGNNTSVSFALNMRFDQATNTLNNSSQFYITEAHLLQDLRVATDFGVFNDQNIWVPIQTNFGAANYGANGFHLTFAPNTITTTGGVTTIADQAPIGGAGHTAANDFTATGFELVDDEDEDFDLMDDSPTQNFALINVLETPSPAANNPRNYTNAALAVQQVFFQGSAYSTATEAFNPAVHSIYTEGRLTGASQYGILLQDPSNITTAPNGIAGLNQPGTIAFHADTVNTRIFSNGTEVGAGGGFPITFGVGDVCRFASSPDGVWIGVNGQWVQNVNGTLTAVNTFPTNNPTLPPLPNQPEFATITGFAEIANCNAFNYGQQPFEFGVPNGFNSLQTQNLTTPPILDGRDHFQAITAGGQAGGLLYSENAAPGGGGLRPALAPLGTLTEPVVSSQALTPTGAGLSALSWIWDAGGVINNANITFLGSSTAGATFDLERSEDGITFVLVRNFSGVNTTQNISGANFRYVRFRATNTNLAGSQNFQSTQGVPILQAAQALFPNGLWWIKSFNANNVEGPTGQHQLCDNTRTVTDADGAIGYPWDGLTGITTGATHAYNAPPGECLAWCWSAPNAWNDNSINNNTGFRNQAAGFSMFQYDGNATRGHTVAHGLNRAPEFILIQCITNSAGFATRGAVYHHLLGPGGSANNTALPATNPNEDFCLAIEQGNAVRGPDAGFWGSTAPDATDITLGENSPMNAAGGTTAGAPTPTVYQCYAWHSVPGYSQFGRWAANNATQTTTADGPFIYTGFTPAAIWVKGTGQAETWSMRDSTRDPNNPVVSNLATNQPNGVTTSAFEVDFLSNGFKIRNGDGVWNFNNSGPYVYACWATNPFGGENTAPVTAR